LGTDIPSGTDLAVRDVSNGPETQASIEQIRNPEEEYLAHSRARSEGLKGSREGCKQLPSVEEIEQRSVHVEIHIAESVAESVNAKVKVANMPSEMQVHAFRCARMACDSQSDSFSSKQLAFAIKKEFDKTYGPAWHCIVGTNFGSFVTHSVGGFLYFFHQARGSSCVHRIRPAYLILNGLIYVTKLCIWIFMLKVGYNGALQVIGPWSVALTSFLAALGFFVYGRRLFFLCSGGFHSRIEGA
jgi:dynein light chain LC8-type